MLTVNTIGDVLVYMLFGVRRFIYKIIFSMYDTNFNWTVFFLFFTPYK